MYFAQYGGIEPAPRKRREGHLTPEERESISRRLAEGWSLRPEHLRFEQGHFLDDGKSVVLQERSFETPDVKEATYLDDEGEFLMVRTNDGSNRSVFGNWFGGDDIHFLVEQITDYLEGLRGEPAPVVPSEQPSPDSGKSVATNPSPGRSGLRAGKPRADR
jgi:hypothetical protein